MAKKQKSTPVALITGSSQRIGAAIARSLHAQNFNVVIHYLHSKTAALRLAKELNRQRSGSAISIQADLSSLVDLKNLRAMIQNTFDRLDVLINNASSFYATPFETANEADWDDLMASNLKGPFFLTQLFLKELKKRTGCIINIGDIYGERPLANYPVYCAAKAGLLMLTKSMAKDLGPAIRVNAIAPGSILWPKEKLPTVIQQKILNRTVMKKLGSPADIAQTVLFLIRSSYITGQIIHVDGGRF